MEIGKTKVDFYVHNQKLANWALEIFSFQSHFFRTKVKRFAKLCSTINSSPGSRLCLKIFNFLSIIIQLIYFKESFTYHNVVQHNVIFGRPAQGTRGASNSLIWGRRRTRREEEDKMLAFMSNKSPSMNFF